MTALAPRQIVLAGTRALDPPERDFVRGRALSVLGPAELATPSALVAAVAAAGAAAVYLHIDLDVLDADEFGAVGYPEPGGISIGQLVAAVRALASRFMIAGAGITEFQPRRPEDQRLLAPVARAVADAVTREGSQDRTGATE
jgi:arginase